MRDDTRAVTDYLLRVAVEEADHLSEEDGLRALPDVAALLRHPLSRTLLRHLQNFCWTVARLRRPQSLGGAATASRATRPALPARPAGAPNASVWIDVTNSVRAAFGGGIDRVAMQLAHVGLETGLALPVVIEGDSVRPLLRRDGEAGTLAFGPGITYVIVDAFWHQIDAYVAICDAARACCAKVVTCFHDVIPIDYPSLSCDGFNATFAKSFARIVAQSDACITVSDYSKDRVRSLIDSLKLRVDRPLPIASFHLGADGPVRRGDDAVRDKIRNLFRGDRVFLGVGTLEPKKGYAVALDAFDSLWDRGIACSFVILGRDGWIAKALEHRILTHPLYGRLLHWVADASDAELTFAYRNAYCLVQASVVEGFGLPIVEASREGTPVIASDIPIFRELAADAITYFKVCDSADLAAAIESAIGRRPDTRPLDVLSWSESLAQMVRRIDDMLNKPETALRSDLPESARASRAPDAGLDPAAPFPVAPQKGLC